MLCVWENMCIWHLKEPVSIVSLFVNGVILMVCEGVSLLFISFLTGDVFAQEMWGGVSHVCRSYSCPEQCFLELVWAGLLSECIP